MNLAKFLTLVKTSEEQLADAFMLVANKHERNAEIRDMSKQLAQWSRNHVAGLSATIARVGSESVDEPQRVRSALFHGARIGGLGLLRDLQDLSLLARQVEVNWTSTHQAAKALHDHDLETLGAGCMEETGKQIAWLETQIKQTAPQAINVEPEKTATIKASLPKTFTPAALPEFIWSPMAAGALMVLVGGIACLAGQPWLIPSLGPTAYLQAETPAHPASRFYNTVVGHLIGLLAGFAAVAIFNAWQSPGVLTDHQLVLARVWASAVALGLTLLIALFLRASHPPAGATTLLVALGAIRTVQDALNAMAGVLIVALFGAAFRRARLKTAAARSG
jgi:hypothetical protein